MNHIWRIVRYSKQLWPLYLGVSFFTVILALLNQTIPILTKIGLDQISALINDNGGSQKTVILVVLGIFLVDVTSTLSSNVGGYLGDRMAHKLQKLLSEKYYEHLLSLPQSYFDGELSGKIISRLNRSINQIQGFMNMMANNFLQFILSTIFTLIVVAWYSWEVALMLGTLYPIFLYLTAITSKKWQSWQHKRNHHFDVAGGRFAEAISQIKVVKSYLYEKRELGIMEKEFNQAVALGKKQSLYWHQQDSVRRMILNVIFFCVYAFIFIRAVQGRFTIPEMVLLIQYANIIRIPIFSMSFIVDNTQRAIADSKDFFEVMSIKPSITDKPNASSVIIKDGEIEFDHVSFAYDDEPVLKDVSFRINKNSKVALVGESGEGKTTLTNLLLRLYEPDKGAIMIDQQDIASVTQVSLRKNIGIVFQDPALFSGSIKENIAYGKPNATLDEIINAAKAANAHEFISKFENKYDSQIGERGLKLSGGQKQRIAIARALLKNAPILILDEATSSLDNKSERLVQAALDRLMKNRTTIIIAHRLSTISDVDKIITMKSGRIDEVGSPSKLAKSGGIYSQLLKMQKSGSIDINKFKEYELEYKSEKQGGA